MLDQKAIEKLREALELGKALASLRQQETKEDQSDAIGQFDAGLRILDACLHDTTWRSQDLKKVFDRLLFGRQDIPDGALAGMIKRVNDSMNETR